jgi:hypothetical protein
MVPRPPWLRASFEEYIQDYDLGEDDIDLGVDIYAGFINQEEASWPYGKGIVESVKVITTDRASKRRRSPKGMNNVTRVYKEATSCTKTKKKLTFTARMYVKPQEESTKELLGSTFSEKPLPPTLVQRVGKLEKYDK